MNSQNNLPEIVGKVTDLSEQDIDILMGHAQSLKAISALEGGDAYIDVLTRDNRLAVVVAQYSPPYGNFYNKSLIGEIMWRQNEPGVYRTLEIGVPSREFKALVSENHIIVRQFVSPIHNNDKIIGVLIVERNIQPSDSYGDSKNKLDNPVNEAVSSSEEINYIAEYMNDAMVQFDRNGIAVYANIHANKLFANLDYPENIVGMTFENLAFGVYTYQEIIDKKRIEHTEIKIGKFILNVTYASIWDEGDFRGVAMLVRDTTEEKIKEEELILKSAVIDEIHHRVKNNLQTIVSIINLQARRTKSAEVRTFAREINGRINSISLTHEILAQEGVDLIDLKELLSRLINTSQDYIVPEELNLTIDISGDALQIESEVATTVALVVNELIQNSIKHAFSGRDKGRISLDIQQDIPYSEVSVTDDGIGMGDTVFTQNNLGHKLVQNLVQKKLKGSISFETSKSGTAVLFRFLNVPDTM